MCASAAGPVLPLGGPTSTATGGGSLPPSGGMAAPIATALGSPVPGDVLQGLVAAIQQLQGVLGGGAAAAPATATGGGPAMPKTAAELAERLDLIAMSRSQRASSLVGAATTNQIAAQQLKQDMQTTEHIQGIAFKVREYASSIDASEVQQVMQVVQQAEQTGTMKAGDVARLMTQIKGSAVGASPAYMAATNTVYDLFDRVGADMFRRQEQIAASANQTGVVDQNAVAELKSLDSWLNEASAAMKRNLDSLSTNPQQAEQRVQQAATQRTLSGIVQALAG